MKRQSILFILLLLLTLFTCVGCSSTEGASPQTAAALPEEASVDTDSMEEFPTEEAFLEEDTNPSSNTESVSGIFEGLEDNHTALFSFDGAESAFFFEDPGVKKVLSEAIIGSTYTLSYTYDSSTGLNVIYKISE